MLRGKSRIFWRYSIAVLTVAIALLGKLLLNYWSGQLRETPFLLFLLPLWQLATMEELALVFWQ